MGKSALLRNIANYIAEREFFQDGILYLDLEKIDNTMELKDEIFFYLE